MPVRELAYHRRAMGGLLETRVTHQVHDVAGRLCEQRDPRLFASAFTEPDVPVNLRTFYSLSGQSLCIDSVDAGWQLRLPGPDGLTVEAWDQRGWHWRIEYDLLLRPVAVVEHFKGHPERCAERITWGRFTPDDALRNRCGVPVRHDDPAGSRLLPDYAMAGSALAEVRHFHESVESPGWPLDEVERDRLLELGDGARSTWHFAPTGEVLCQTDAKGRTRHFRYDRGGQLRGIRLQQAQRTTAEILVGGIEYSAAGQVLHELAGNGMRTFSSYDPASGQLLTLANQSQDGTFLQNLSYRHDPAGNITAITEDALPLQHFANQRVEPVRHFVYDTLYQLISATGWESAKPSLGPALPEWQDFGSADSSRWCNYTETYFYDAAGNLLQRVHQGAVNDTLNMQVAAHSNRSIKDRPGAELDGLFDARGNLVELQPGQSLQWNGRNELSEVVQVARHNAPGDREFYSYDHEGMRVRKCRTAAAKSITHSAEVRYLPGLELHSNSATGEQLQVLSIQAGRCSVRLLHWDSPPPEGVDNDQLRYCFDDHLGSSAFEVDAEAKPISQEIYYPFGGTAWLAGRGKVETSYKTIRYSGKERDATGLYYYGVRYYMPWFHRWLNPDPAENADGLSFYKFTRNNPTNCIDRTGLNSVWASINDFVLEGYHIRWAVSARGMAAIRSRQPEVAVALDSAFERAVTLIDNAVKAFYEPSSRGAIEKYAGAIAADKFTLLKRNIEAMQQRIHKYGANSEKMVLLKGRLSVAGKVFDWDRRSKIYLNGDVLLTNTVEANAHLLLHELSHIVVRTKDYWYSSGSVDKAGSVDSQDAYGMTFNDNVAEFQFINDSSRILRGDIECSDIERDLLSDFHTKDKGVVISQFKARPAMRGEKALRNADTFVAILRSLSRSHQKHSNAEVSLV
ncbi:RHS repeat domain-containing protein [Pseudomonas sp. TMB3-21]